MPKRRHEVKLLSYGLYTGWDPNSDSLPQIQRHTTDIPAQLGIEFGYILEIRKARGCLLRLRIDHPPFPAADGTPAPPFVDELYIRGTPYTFFVGDTIWAPVEDKCGPWTLTVWIDDEEVATKTFTVRPASQG